MPTLDELWCRYLEGHAKPHLKTWRNLERCFNPYFDTLRDRDSLSIKRYEVQHWHTQIGQEIGWTTANRAFQLLRSIYYKAIDWELIPNHNPTVRVKCKTLQPRERFLQPEELSRFFSSCSTLRYATTRDFFLMCLFTGQRAGNVRNMRWDQISFELALWSIPNTKNGTSHKLPLVPEAMATLKARRSLSKVWVFPGRTTNQGQSSVERPLGKNGCRDAWLHW